MSPEERREHCRRIGARGGRATVERYGREHMSEIGRMGFDAALQSIGGRALAEILAPSYEARFGRQLDLSRLRDAARPEYIRAQRARAQARRANPSITCAICGQKGECHHVNGTDDPTIIGLCRAHHIQHHHEQRAAARQLPAQEDRHV